MNNLQKATYNNVNLQETVRFLNVLDPNAFSFTFQTFDDVKTRKNLRVACLFNARLDHISKKLIELNEHQAGVFVTVNETDGKGRKKENIRRVRAIWGEFDNGVPSSLPLKPSIIIETSPGKYHYYWLVNGLSFEQHHSVMERLIREYGSDPNARDLSRVLRLPGFLHHKEQPFRCRLLEINGKVYTASEIVQHFPPVRDCKQCSSKGVGNTPWKADESRLVSALKAVPAFEYGVWVKVGMALHHEYHGDGTGLRLWNDWSQTCPDKFDNRTQVVAWRSFSDHPNAITVATLYSLAKQHGWSFCSLKKSNLLSQNSPKTMDTDMSENSIIPIGPNLKMSARDDFLIDDLLWLGDVSALVGESGAGKSFLATDMGIHIALGYKWLGQHIKSTGVLYLILEGQRAVINRFIAQVERFSEGFANEQRPPIAYATPQLNLCDPSHKEHVIKIIKDFEKEFGQSVGFLVIDTVAQSLGGDENSFTDMQAYIGNCTEIAKEAACHVMLVHHFGKNVSLGPRGHTCFFAACDTVIAIKKEKTDSAGTIEVMKQKDASMDFSADMELEPVSLGTFELGDLKKEITTCIPKLKKRRGKP